MTSRRFTDLDILAIDRNFLHVEVECIEAGVLDAQICWRVGILSTYMTFFTLEDATASLCVADPEIISLSKSTSQSREMWVV